MHWHIIVFNRRAGAEQHVLQVDEKEDLTIDVSIVRGNKATPEGPLLLHTSGVHGVEAFAGSSVQHAYLKRLVEVQH